MTTKLLMPRQCTSCNRGMAEGAVIDDGFEYYCSNICLHTKYTKEEFDEMYDDGEGSSYFTDWEDEDDIDPDDQAEEISAFAYGKLAMQAGLARIPGLDHEFCASMARAPIPEELRPLDQWLEGFDSAKNESDMSRVNYYIIQNGLNYEQATAKVQLEQFEEEHSPRVSNFI